jgi:hypothetical protein
MVFNAVESAVRPLNGIEKLGMAILLLRVVLAAAASDYVK